MYVHAYTFTYKYICRHVSPFPTHTTIRQKLLETVSIHLRATSTFYFAYTRADFHGSPLLGLFHFTGIDGTDCRSWRAYAAPTPLLTAAM